MPPSNQFCKAFVERLYPNFMNRPADQGGLDYWSDRLEKGEVAHVVAHGFAASQEFHNLIKEYVSLGWSWEMIWSEVLYRHYKAFFDREPDEGGRQYWMNELADGLPLVNGSSSDYNRSLLTGFTASQEFQNLCDRYCLKATIHSPIPPGNCHGEMLGLAVDWLSAEEDQGLVLGQNYKGATYNPLDMARCTNILRLKVRYWDIFATKLGGWEKGRAQMKYLLNTILHPLGYRHVILEGLMDVYRPTGQVQRIVDAVHDILNCGMSVIGITISDEPDLAPRVYRKGFPDEIDMTTMLSRNFNDLHTRLKQTGVEVPIGPLWSLNGGWDDENANPNDYSRFRYGWEARLNNLGIPDMTLLCNDGMYQAHPWMLNISVGNVNWFLDYVTASKGTLPIIQVIKAWKEHGSSESPMTGAWIKQQLWACTAERPPFYKGEGLGNGEIAPVDYPVIKQEHVDATTAIVLWKANSDDDPESFGALPGAIELIAEYANSKGWALMEEVGR